MENVNQPGKILYRSSTNRVIFGVCGGLGEYFVVDPIIFRILFLLLTFGAGSGVLIYLVLAFLIPKNPSSDPVKNNSENINVKDKINELVAELKDLKHSSDRQGRRGVFRLLLGLIILTIGFSLLAENLNLFPGFHFYFSALFDLWPVLVILLGLSIVAKGF